MDNIISKISVDGVIYDINSGVDTSDATATSKDILLGKTAYVEGLKIIGEIISLNRNEYVPSTEDKIIVAGNYLDGDQIIKGEPNLIPSNIIKGKTIYGIEGTSGGYIYSASNAGSYTNFDTKTGNNRNDASSASSQTKAGTVFGYRGAFGFRSSIVCPFDGTLTFNATSGTGVYKNNAGISSGSSFFKDDVLGVERSESNSTAGGHGAFIILTPND